MAGILGTHRARWADEAACERTARQLASCPELSQALITLHGPLGAGKTTFARQLLRALGVAGRIKSPTFSVLEPYEVGGLSISHLDLYRFADPREWEDAGLREVVAAPGLKLVEWPQKAGSLLPPPDLELHIDIAEDGSRPWTAQARSRTGLALLRALDGKDSDEPAERA